MQRQQQIFTGKRRGLRSTASAPRTLADRLGAQHSTRPSSWDARRPCAGCSWSRCLRAVRGSPVSLPVGFRPRVKPCPALAWSKSRSSAQGQHCAGVRGRGKGGGAEGVSPGPPTRSGRSAKCQGHQAPRLATPVALASWSTLWAPEQRRPQESQKWLGLGSGSPLQALASGCRAGSFTQWAGSFWPAGFMKLSWQGFLEGRGAGLGS